jgi:anhydro-N-acetylmuramic acid kinase
MYREAAKSISYKVLGLMSGTSLDGVDLALCNITRHDRKWEFEILKADTLPYPANWRKKLKDAFYFSKDEINELDKEYGIFLGKLINNFLDKNSGTEYISSHGHTIFHNPEKGITRQIGKGELIAKMCKIPVIFDFRSKDISLGGQGAPLVPVGDRELFSQYDACLNMGGFSNISFEKDKSRIAFDICPVNIVLNKYSSDLGFEFDKNGEIGKNGHLIPALLDELNSLDYYKKTGPASLSYEWLKEEFFPVIDKKSYQNKDILRTLYEHISFQISKVLNCNKIKNVLITGGGAFNSFLIERIQKQSSVRIVIPDEKIINYKEALIFAFLGILRVRNENNCLASVTGASHDNIGGKIVQIK